MARHTAKRESTAVENYMGHTSYVPEDKLNLALTCLSTFLEDSYYESRADRIIRISNLVGKIARKDPEFVAKLAVYARTQFHLRSIFPVLIGELAKAGRGTSLVRQAIWHGATRFDDLTEILAYSLDNRNKQGTKVPAQIKKGLANAVHKFNRYQIAKYRGENRDVSARDLFNLVHPKPLNLEEEETFRQLMSGELVSTGTTWESRLSAGEDAGYVFQDLLEKKELGYMACLRNLRNILNSGNQKAIDLACDYISNPDAVKHSKQLPFRFLSARVALEDNDKAKTSTFKFEGDASGNKKKMIDAIAQALTYSINNLPDLPGKTLILTDNSGSMHGDRGGSSVVSAYSRTTTAAIANLFAVLYFMKAENTAIGLFGDRLIQPALNRSLDIFENYDIIHKVGQEVGYSTEAGIFTAFETLIENETTDVARIVIFSDQQIGDGCSWFGRDGIGSGGQTFNKLFQKFKDMSPDTQVYSIDVKGYGTTVFKDRMTLLGGWSDKIFEIMKFAEQDKKALINDIQNVKID